MKKPIANKANSPEPKEYAKVFFDIKKHISEAQTKAILAVNKELIQLYWYIGKTVTEQQKLNGWGSKTIEQLASDIQNSFPGITGFSRRNIYRMQSFFLAYETVPQAVAQMTELPIFNIPWGHNAVIIEHAPTLDKI